MKFYEAIAKYYDDIFPTGRKQVEFLEHVLEESPKEVLDIACGTGNYSIALAKKGHELTSIDLDYKMIEMLKLKIENHNLAIQALEGNMLELDKVGGSYDMAFCIGNSLVHLQSLEDISLFVKNVRNILKNNGKLILQIVNYDRIMKHEVKALPTIENDTIPLSFERLYEYDQNNHKINFHTILKVEDNEVENTIPLYPLHSKDLLEVLKSSGFTKVECYGDFSKKEYNQDTSFMLVIEAS